MLKVLKRVKSNNLWQRITHLYRLVTTKLLRLFRYMEPKYKRSYGAARQLLKPYLRKVGRYVNWANRHFNRLPFLLRQVIVVGLFIGLVIGVKHYQQQSHYTLSQEEQQLLTQPTFKAENLKETTESIIYNAEKPDQPKPEGETTVASNELDGTGEVPYKTEIFKDPTRGIKFGDNKGALEFMLVPQFEVDTGRYQDGRVTFPRSSNSRQVLTLKRNGIKEDILLRSAPGRTATYSWSLELGDKLEARLMPDGSVGIFAASPYLYGDLQVSDEKSQELIDKARTTDKNYLAFVLPAPYIKDAEGREIHEDTSFKLEGNILTLEARNLGNKKYPLTIDPSVVVSTDAQFRQGKDDGMIDYTGQGHISRRDISAGATGTFTTSYFILPRYNHTSVAYNGYLYVIGGLQGDNDGDCKDSGTGARCNDIEYAPINANGSIGTFTTNTSYFSIPRELHSSIAYNGYLYVIGGQQGVSSTDCKDSTTSTRCNDVQYAPINADGSVGTFTTNTNYFSIARYNHESVAYNGYLYVIGGLQASNTNCKNTGVSSTFCNDVQYAPINADGSVGTFTTNANYFSTPRDGHSSVAYNGYLYVVGGNITSDTACKDTGTSTRCNDVQYAPINADGSVGTFTTNANYFSTPRHLLASVAYNGYLYVVGGDNAGSSLECKNTGISDVECNDVQYAKINADGSVGTFTTNTNYFSIPRSNHEAVAYNGNLYIIGGSSDDGDTDCKNTGLADFQCNDVQHARISEITGNGSVGTFTTNSNYFSFPRRGHSSVVYNGYLYIVGGLIASSSTDCKDSGSSDKCNDVQYAPINADGSIGSWSTNSTYFAFPRYLHQAEVHNSYLYVSGGLIDSSSTDCKDSGTSTRCNDVQYAPINADGSVGTFTTNTNYFSFPRHGHTSTAYNGYLYISGGALAASGTDCKNSGTSTVCNDIQYAPINANGSVGTFTTNTNYFTRARSGHDAIIYDGYIYITGGFIATNSTDCKNSGSTSTCNDIQYAPINADGSVGTFTTNTNYFSFPRQAHTAVAHDGYIYISGGLLAASGTDCKNSGTSTVCNDIQYAPINANGSVGTFTTNTNYFTTARSGHESVAHNGHLYIIGGNKDTSDTNCKDSGTSIMCNDIQRALLDTGSPSGGAVGATTQQTNAFTTARTGHTSVVYNGYLYIIGGYIGSNIEEDDIQRCPINADGSVGTCVQQTNAFTSGRFYHTLVVYNGYLYIMGGCTSFNINCVTETNTIVHCPINADSSVGTCVTKTNAFTRGRRLHTSVVYNGYIYIIGGISDNETLENDIQRCPINADSSVGTCVQQTNAFTTARGGHTSVVYNGYIYIIGGDSGSLENDIQRCPINADSSVGTCVQQTNAFTTARTIHASVAYNGYLYVIGGGNGGNTRYNDIQRLPINADGSVGTTVSQAAAFTTTRYGHASVVYKGYLYVVGGESASYQNDIQHLSIGSIAQSAHYEKIIDVGSESNLTSLVINGRAGCGYSLSYRTAGNSGTFGSKTSFPFVVPGATVSMTENTKRYLWVSVDLNDEACGAKSTITDITLNYNTLGPDPPVLIAPANNSTGVSITPEFQLRSAEPNGDYIRYEIIVYQSNCSTVVRTIDQTASQTGWSGQDTQSNTAYVGNANVNNSTIAVHTYQAAALTSNTTYCWKARGIDPGGSNIFGNYSSTQSFTTNQVPGAPTLSLPTASQTGVSTLPELRLYGTDAENDYLMYWIEVCSTSNCSAIVRTICQTSSGTSPPGTCSSPSQTGWRSQSQQSNTAYSSGQEAIHKYQTAALTPSTQYWWRAYAIDPGGSNTWGSASSIGTFTTGSGTAPGNPVQIQGGTNFRGGTRIGN